MSQSNLLPDTDCDSLRKFKVMRVLHLSAAAMVTVVMMTMIMMVTPALINDDDDDDDYSQNCDDDNGNDSKCDVQCWPVKNDDDVQYVHVNHDGFILTSNWVKMNLNMNNPSPLH